MFQWLVNWAKRYQQREIERLRDESRRLREEVMKREGGAPIRLSEEQRRLLAEKAKGIDPEVLKEIAVLELTGSDSEPSNDTSTESP